MSDTSPDATEKLNSTSNPIAMVVKILAILAVAAFMIFQAIKEYQSDISKVNRSRKPAVKSNVAAPADNDNK